MISLFRSVLFDILFVIITFVMVSVGVVTLLFPLAVMNAYKQIWLRLVFFLMKVVLGLRYRVLGYENLPKGPFILACKHQSTLETFILPYIFPHLLICLKKELIDMPISGWYFKKYGMVGINRKNPKKALVEIIHAAKNTDLAQSPLLVFPEGTRTKPGKRSAYKPGIGIFYEALKVPVVPISLNTGVFWPRHSLRRYPGITTLKILPPLSPGLSRAEFMEKLEGALEDESMALYDEAMAQATKVESL